MKTYGLPCDAIISYLFHANYIIKKIKCEIHLPFVVSRSVAGSAHAGTLMAVFVVLGC